MIDRGIDVDWLLRCPLLSRLRPVPRFENILRVVQARADRMWE